MSKPKQQTREVAKAMVSPLFAWTNAMLKGGEMMLDSMEAMAKNARSVRVAVIPDADAPPRKRAAPRSGKNGKRSRARKSR